MKIMRITGVVAAAVAAVVVAGCGSTPGTTGSGPNSSSSSAVNAAHNEADIAFVQGMIPHHSQAIEMARLAPDRAASPQVKEIALAIEKAQDPEIAQMRGFLAAWGVKEDAGMAGMEGHGGSGGQMSGMMTGAQLDQLRRSTGATFDRMFLQMMIEHHTGAIEQAQTELAGGQSTDAKALAQNIINAQRAEIAQMQKLLTAV